LNWVKGHWFTIKGAEIDFLPFAYIAILIDDIYNIWKEYTVDGPVLGDTRSRTPVLTMDVTLFMPPQCGSI
jgi:hypothetical protein